MIAQVLDSFRDDKPRPPLTGQMQPHLDALGSGMDPPAVSEKGKKEDLLAFG